MTGQRRPWASGKPKPAAGKPKRRRRRRKMSTRSKALASFWEALALLLLGCSQIFETSALIFAGATSAALGAATVYFEKRQNGAVPPPHAARPKPAKPAKNATSGGGRGRPGTVQCTRTGQPADQCSCAARHVKTVDGARRYKRQVGDPMGGKPGTGGGKVSTTKPQRVPSTNNAKPLPPGEHMRRVL